MGSTTSTTSPVSIASSSSAGAAGGSVINVSSLVSQLVTATETPQQNLINTQQEANTTQISALGTLKSALSTFQSSLSALDTPSAFDTETANTSSTAFTATATSGAPVGTYNVSISQLASAQQLLSGAFTGSGTASVGSGTLQISLGGSSFNVTIGSGNDSLNAIASAINSATGNPGVTATVLQGTDGAHLLLTSTQTGAANTIGVSETDSGTGLSALTYDSADADSKGDTTNYTQQAPAQNAEYSLSGVAGSSPSNTVSNALTGVTLSFVSTTTASTTPATLTVASDTSTIETNISAFVSAYNTLLGTFQSLGGYDSASQTAGPMMGNALLSSTQSQMGNAIYSIVNTGSSTYNSLASIGITTNSDGTLSLNNGTLANALSTNFSAVSTLFSSPGGVATSLNSQLTNDLGSTGAIAENETSLTAQSTALSKQTTQLNAQMTALTASLTQQYSALNNLLSSLQTTSSYLTQAFSSLPQVDGTPNA
jgi:flagellar hook-associated protein 2